jgi:hypothetical protein
MIKKILTKLLTITLVISGCTTYQPPESYSIDASLKGSFDGEYYTSANNQFRVKPIQMEPLIHIKDHYDSDTDEMAVFFESKASTFFIVVTSGKATEAYNYDTQNETLEKHNGDSIKNRIPLSVFGDKGITLRVTSSRLFFQLFFRNFNSQLGVRNPQLDPSLG